jgi:cell division protein FtsL
MMASGRQPPKGVRISTLLHGLLVLAVLVSAFATVYIKDLQRRLFITYQQRDVLHEQLVMQWGQLLLEQATLARQDRIVQAANTRLNMHLPKPNQVRMLVLPKEDPDAMA